LSDIPDIAPMAEAAEAEKLREYLMARKAGNPVSRPFDELDIRLGAEALDECIKAGMRWTSFPQFARSSRSPASSVQGQCRDRQTKRRGPKMHSHQAHRKHLASARRAKQFMAENACGGKVPHKKHGGAAGMKHGPARGNDSEADLRSEGGKGKHRIARKAGGKVRHQTNIVIVGHHPPAMGTGALPAAGPMTGAPGAPIPAPGVAPPTGPAAGLMAPGMAPGQPVMRKRGGGVHSTYEDPPEDISDYKPAHVRKNQGGSLDSSYGAASGMSRRAEYRKMRGKGN
jgi:hypothetical protein